jgi:hypothetical protein
MSELRGSLKLQVSNPNKNRKQKQSMNSLQPERTGDLARNVAIAMRFKKSQGTAAMSEVEKELLAPNYDRVRGGNFNLANNGRGQGWATPGMYLRDALPDRVDIMEQVIADGDRVGLLFRVTGTHLGSLFGIAPTGRRIDVYEMAWLRIAGGQIAEGWFMLDETSLLKQLGARIPLRDDSRIISPPVVNTGEPKPVVVARLAGDPTALAQNKLRVAQSLAAIEGSAAAMKHTVLRTGFHHLHEFSARCGLHEFSIDAALCERADSIEVMMAEGDTVWMRLNVAGRHGARCVGLEPTGKDVGVPMAVIARLQDGRCVESWSMADELGLLLQMGAPNLVL